MEFIIILALAIGAGNAGKMSEADRFGWCVWGGMFVVAYILWLLGIAH
jgi:hypothetical protein